MLANFGHRDFDNLIEKLIEKKWISNDDASIIINKAETDSLSNVWRAFSKCYAMTGKAKLKSVCEYVKGVIANGVKFIVYAHHKEVLDGVENEIRSHKIKYIRIDGSTS